jgi:hypothetical protein
MPDDSTKVTPQPSPEAPISIIPNEPTTVGTTSIPNIQPSTSQSKLQETFDKAVKNNVIPPPQEEDNYHGK